LSSVLHTVIILSEAPKGRSTSLPKEKKRKEKKIGFERNLKMPYIKSSSRKVKAPYHYGI
jgi:hypothetical protein